MQILKLLGVGSLAEAKLVNLVVAGLILMASVATTATTLTGAIFSDAESIGSNVFSNGTVDISLLQSSAVMGLGNMSPGDKTTSPLTVSNAGSLQLRYAVTTTTTENALAAQLDLIIWDEYDEADDGVDCNSTPPSNVLYGPGDVGSTAGLAVLGDPAQGEQAGDRTLSGGSLEVLCVQVSLPPETGNEFQGMSTNVDFTFAAEQTTNNSSS